MDESIYKPLTDAELDEYEALMPALMRELRGVPCYVVNSPADYPKAPNVGAFTPAAALDWCLFDEVDRRCGWRGDGPVIVFNQPARLEQSLAILLHELGHNTRARRPVFPRKFRDAQLAMIACVLGRSVGSLPTMPAWYSAHGFSFVRRCIHLHHRAWKLGFEVGCGDMNYAGPLYDLSPSWAYRRALGNEPRRMEGRMMAAICASAAPKAFRKLFHADYQRWLDGRHQQSPTTGEDSHVTA